MIGWARRRLRARIFLAFSALLLGLLLTTLWLTQSAVSRQIQETLQAEMRVTGSVFERSVAHEAERLLDNAQLFANDHSLKQVMALFAVNPDTLASAAQSYQRRVGVDLFWIVDDAGVLMADGRGRQGAGRDLAKFPPVALAMERGEPAVAIAEVDGVLHQFVVVPVLAPDLIGYLVAGRALDDARAGQLKADTGSDVSFLTAGRLFASSWPAAERDFLLVGGRPAPTVVAGRDPTAFVLARRGERFLSLLVPIRARLDSPLYALVQRSYDEALRPLHALRVRIVVIGLAAVGAALLVGAALSASITAPVRTLVVGTQEVLRGNLRHRLSIRREDEIGVLARSFNEMVKGLEIGEQVKDTFGRFVSPEVAEAVLGGSIPLSGSKREVTILFQDLRGFTTISERMDPVDILALLNRFFTRAVAAVEAEGGVVKQFTGDGLMALFGAPVAHADDPSRAVRAGLGILRGVEELNRELAAEGKPPLRIGVGIHTGEVVAGMIGPDKRVEYGTVGDAVNLASRIEGLTKEMSTAILVSAATAERLTPDFNLGRSAVLKVKGKEKPVEVIEVLGLGAARVQVQTADVQR